MAETVQCGGCGAVLAPEDLFCGECGASRPQPAPAAAPAGSVPPPAPLPAPSAVPVYRPAPPIPPVSRPPAATEGWRTAARVISILATLAALGMCGLGLVIGFFSADPETGQVGSTDMVLGSAILCAGPGVLALIVAVVLWLVAARRR